MQHQRILILDFGSQVTQLIARRVREAGVYCEVHPNDVDDAFIRSFAPEGVILSGSHASTYEAHELRAPALVFDLGVPVLGICYGMFTMAVQLGGTVEASTVREFGYAEVRARGHTRLFDGIQDFATAEGHGMLKVWMSHGDKVTALPPGFKLMASTSSCPIAGMADEARRFYAVQFHPEVTHTVQGQAILTRFVREICGCRGDWNMPDYVTEAVAKIREQVGAQEVILGLSGGVDSSVAAALIHKAIGHQLTCVFVDTGLLRLNEGAQVVETFEKHMGLKLIHIDASERFMRELAGVADPEAKRKIIGREFVHVFQEEAAKLPNAKWLAQGTIYPTSSKAPGPRPRRRPRSRATITSAACLTPCICRCWSRCVSCSRTRCVRSASRLACRPRWCIGIRFPVLASGCASSARSSASSPTCCAGPITSSSKNFDIQAGTTRRARRSPCSCRSRVSA
jgi:GMP synthase (glutamine-hydrolysing)